LSKIYIIGIVASGKTTLSRQLSRRLNIPCYELDSIVHHKTEQGRYKRTPEQQAEVIREIDIAGNWILEGTYRESYHQLFDMADSIIFLDIPLWKRKVRILLRFIKQQLKIEKCNYKSDINMLKKMYKWTRDFENNRVEFVRMLSQYDNKLITIKNANTSMLDTLTIN
jgi:adenylate kinase family enzyme